MKPLPSVSGMLSWSQGHRTVSNQPDWAPVTRFGSRKATASTGTILTRRLPHSKRGWGGLQSSRKENSSGVEHCSNRKSAVSSAGSSASSLKASDSSRGMGTRLSRMDALLATSPVARFHLRSVCQSGWVMYRFRLQSQEHGSRLLQAHVRAVRTW